MRWAEELKLLRGPRLKGWESRVPAVLFFGSILKVAVCVRAAQLMEASTVPLVEVVWEVEKTIEELR